MDTFRLIVCKVEFFLKMLKVGLKGAKETEVLIAMTSDYFYVYGYVLLVKKVLQPKSC